jgi:hypothetical protein
MPLRGTPEMSEEAVKLLSQTQSFDNLAVPIGITTIQIIQQTPAPVHHHDQAAA